MGNKNSQEKKPDVMLRVTPPPRPRLAVLRRTTVCQRPYSFAWRDVDFASYAFRGDEGMRKYALVLFPYIKKLAKTMNLSREEVARLTADDAEDYWYRNLQEVTERIRRLGLRRLVSQDGDNFYHIFDKQIIVNPKHTPRQEMLVAIADFNGLMCELRETCAFNINDSQPPPYDYEVVD